MRNMSFHSVGGAVRRQAMASCRMGVSILMAARCAAAMDLGVCAHVGRDEFAERDRAFDMMRDAGISWVRTDFEWFRCQSEKDGPFDFSLYDTVIDDARERGLAVLPIFWSPPKWAQPDLSGISGTRPFVVQPDAAFLDAWRAFVREAALHFKGRFSAIEIWNEENHPSFWLNPDAAAYVSVLRAAYEEIKAVDPSVTVLLGGLAGTPLDYIEALYNAGAKDFFDAMNVHPYTWPNPPDGELERQLRGLKETMAAHGDAGKPIWITEIGWPTQKARLPAQNLFLAALKAARPERTAWRVGYVEIDEDTPRGVEFAEAMRELLLPGSTAEAYTPRQLVAKLEADALDAVVYPYAESFPLRTVDAVVDFVRRGGVLVDFGGCTWFPYLDGKLVEKNPDGRLYREILQERLRTNIVFPSAENGLTPSTKTYATDAAAAAGLKPDPNGFTCFRFYDGKRLKPGDRFIPLTSARTKDGREVAGVGLYKFGSDYKGAVVMAGCGGDKGGTSEADQAKYIMRSIEIAQQFGVDKYFIYEFRSPGLDPYYSEDHFGIVQRDFTPKATYLALRDFCRRIRRRPTPTSSPPQSFAQFCIPPRVLLGLAPQTQRGAPWQNAKSRNSPPVFTIFRP